MNMIHLDSDFYNELAQELITAIYDKQNFEGVIELKVLIARNRYADIIFAFNAQDFTLEHGIEEINYLIIALEGTVRCSSDFDSNKLLPLLEDI